jgi:hypothetical protein
MLIGKGRLRLPAYTGAQPAVLTITCECRQRYVVLTGVADAGAELVRREAERRGAVFVDARETPHLALAAERAEDRSEQAPADLAD